MNKRNDLLIEFFSCLYMFFFLGFKMIKLSQLFHKHISTISDTCQNLPPARIPWRTFFDKQVAHFFFPNFDLSVRRQYLTSIIVIVSLIE